jgi:translocator protein
MKRKNSLVKLGISILIVLTIGFLGSFFTSSSVNEWYPTINKPSFNPPNWLFGPVWTILYIMIGISIYLVWTTKDKEELKKKTYFAFGTQLVLNFLWSFLFFGNRMILGALICIFALLMAILVNIVFARKISKTAGWLLMPYFAWVGFATILNFAIWMLN